MNKPAKQDDKLPLTRQETDFTLAMAPLAWLNDWHEQKNAFLEPYGFQFRLFVNHQYAAVVKGGLRTSGVNKSSSSYDAILVWDLGAIDWIEGGEMLLHFQGNFGAGINPFAGTRQQVYDDADGSESIHIGQLWYRQHLLDRKLAVRFGFLDFQTIIDRNAYANTEDIQFMNQSLDDNPLVPLNIGLGLSIEYQPVYWYRLIVGAGDAQSRLYQPGFATAFHDDAIYFGYLENDFTYNLRSSRGLLPGHVRQGFVYNPNQFTRFPREKQRRPNEYTGDVTFYLNFDQMLYREKEEEDQGLGVFGRFACRDAATHTVSQFYSAGLSYKGLIPGRDRDVTGFAFSLQSASELARERVDPTVSDETVYEMYHQFQIGKYLTISPDIQYIDNPGGSGETAPALVIGIRSRLSL